MAKVYFAFGIHNHQPIGNFNFVFEDAYQKSYLPFLEKLEAHPKIRIAQHYSGILFDWILANHPDYIQRLAQLTTSGQVEMMTGAHFEPILMTIPDRDKIGQILKLTQTVKKHTRYDAKGLWLAERVWEPHLPKVLREAHVEYTIVDDSHFKYAGLKEDQLAGYYVTEEQGATINVFPISEKLRYTIPFQNPEATLDYLREIAERGDDQVAIFADDGEKFGVWPGTYDHVFTNNWLEHFFSAVEQAGDWVEMIHFSEVLRRIAPKGRVYLPAASYREMMEWALPFRATRELEDFENKLKESDLFDRYGIYVRGGFWRNFLAKYPESNRMHKKMLYVSRKIEQNKEKLSRDLQIDALDHLWAGQCNCSYWHGVFGGLYLTHLRYAIYKNLIQAENILDKTVEKKNITTSVFDLTGNGKQDIIVESPILNLYIDPAIGGNIFELDYKPGAVNLIDTMTRREEAYHRKLLKEHQNNHADGVASIHDLIISKEENLQQYLKYDWYDRNALIDHFLAPNTSIRKFADSQYHEIGDFIHHPYEFDIKSDSVGANIILSRDGFIRMKQEQVPVRISKKLTIYQEKSLVQIEYRIRNISAEKLDLHFGVEWNTGLLAGHNGDRFYRSPDVEIEDNYLDSFGELPELYRLSLIDLWQNLKITFAYHQPTTIWRFPIETISLSEAGFERVYQNSVVLSHWKFALNDGEEKRISFSYEIEAAQ
ncbi:MAG TPA: DUF1926 domain-containing protein [Bacteroidetes bacterium]|nr:DUF1926 domain-containing protein [Bacteroidota bacterium]